MSRPWPPEEPPHDPQPHGHHHRHSHHPPEWAQERARKYWERHRYYRRSFGPLRRRMFLWFGLSILLTMIAVAGAMVAVSRPSSDWNKNVIERLRTFAAGRFAAVWDRPQELGDLAQSVSRDLGLDVEIRGADGALLATYGQS